MNDLTTRLTKLDQNTADSVRCPVGRLVDSLPADSGDRLVRLLAKPKKVLSTRQIHSELQLSGCRIGRDSLDLHRDGRCVCRGSE